MSLDEPEGKTKVTHTTFPVEQKKKAAKKLETSSGFTMHFVLERETKGAIRYMQVQNKGDVAAWMSDEGAQCGTIYFRKSAFADGKYPKAIEIAVTY